MMTASKSSGATASALPNSQIAFLFAGLLLSQACVNPYVRFYRSYIGDQTANTIPGYVPCDDSVHIYSTDNFARDAKQMVRHGYAPIGEASFTSGGQGITEDNVREQAELLGACAALVSTKFAGTVSGAVPWQVPDVKTSYTSDSASYYGSGGFGNAYGSGVTTTYGTRTVMMPYTQNRYASGAIFWLMARNCGPSTTA